jgi:hypothetical protein
LYFHHAVTISIVDNYLDDLPQPACGASVFESNRLRGGAGEEGVKSSAWQRIIATGAAEQKLRVATMHRGKTEL